MNYKKIIIYVLLLIFLIIISFGIYFYIAIKKPISNQSEQVSIEIIEGQTTEEISQELKDANLIRSTLAFQAYVLYKNSILHPGIYYISKNSNFDQIIEILSQGIVDEEKITILEGWCVRDIAEYLNKKIGIDGQAFISEAESLEGFLFPDTYQIVPEATNQEILKKLNNNFKQKTSDLNLTKDQLILASIVEREAVSDDDRAMIAGVYQNRLDIGMKLDADPTVQYAKGSWDLLTQADYSEVISPYNTYLNAGLPPGPICNPGLASIKAAIDPAKHDYFYFFHLADGTTIFSKTLDEHNQNIAIYADEL